MVPLPSPCGVEVLEVIDPKASRQTALCVVKVVGFIVFPLSSPCVEVLEVIGPQFSRKPTVVWSW